MPTTSDIDRAALRDAVRAMTPRIRADLIELVRMDTVSAHAAARPALESCANAVATMLRDAGCAGVSVDPIDGGPPAVIADVPAPPGAPTVLLYAHYDVQPAGDESRWTSPPFEPTERDGRLYGRGAADDKSGVVAIVATMRAFGGRPPVGVRILIEGEEEIGSPNLERHMNAHPERYAADLHVITDSGNVRLGEPTLTTTLRGLASCRVTVRTLDAPVHSGMYGGPVPDALMVLIKLLATLQDDRGDVAIEGLRSDPWDGLDVTEEAYRSTAGVVDGVPLVGSGTISERLWTRPAVNVIALDAPRTDHAANIVVPSAEAIVSLRIAPDESPQRAGALLAEHVRTHAPWGVAVEVEELQSGEGFFGRTDGPGIRAALDAMREAYGVEPQAVGQGGSIPLAILMSRCAEGGAGEVVLWGAQDDAASIHGYDESVDFGELVRSIEAQVLLLADLAP